MAISYDLIIIGAGSGGLVAAHYAAQMGVKVALVEKRRIGGDCTWTGCVPSKALLKAARVAHTVHTSAQYGVSTASSVVDMSAVRDYVRRAIAGVDQYEKPDLLKKEGIDPILGMAHFIDPDTIQVGEQTLTAKHFILTTGSHPNIPQVKGLGEVPFFTYERFFENDRLPTHLLILGAGPVGVEMAQAYARLGAKVTLVGRRILRKDDPQAVEVIQRVLTREGIQCVTGNVIEAGREGDTIVLATTDQKLRGDMLLVAAGRMPTVEGLGLEKAGVKYSSKGIEVDEYLQTSARRIYAAGDCVGGYQFTHYAGWQAFQAVRNALFPGHSQGFTNIIPWTTFTDPELAQVGLTEPAARESFGNDVGITCWNLDRIDRAVTENDQDGFIKFVHRKDGTLLGATIVAERAGEAITEFVAALQHGAKLNDLAGPIHVYPTYSSAIQQMAAQISFTDFLQSSLGKVVVHFIK